jgi:ATP-dependent DNA helicase PIF1
VDLSGGMFSTGQLYVALSRCTSMNGLVLKRPVLPRDLKIDRRIARFLRSAVRDGGARRYCAIGMLTVGDEGRMSRPRPVELAVAFDDGTAMTTLINPQRDLADARTAFGINLSDVLLAPTLREAWAVIAPMLAGCTPVGVGIDETLGLVDFELKRLGYVTAMPLGVELRGARVSGRTALERAQSALAAHGGSDSEEGSSAFEEPEPAESVSGLLVSRDHSVRTPAADHLPGLSALLRVSRDVGAVLLGGSPSREGVDTSWDAAARQSVADQLRTAASRAQLPAEVVERLREASRMLGAEIAPESTCLEGDDIGSVLTPGARICFTGTAQDSTGQIVERWEMEQLAKAAGLTPVKSVTKTRCEVLVTAEAGTQSGKARKAQEYGKPVFTADEFFAWLAETPAT